MDPIYIILYAVIVTLILTLVLPRFKMASPKLGRTLLVVVIVGGIALLVITFFAFV